uniref:Trafficking protein particle complex subunit n=1 Tax=Dermatophagoides pteronyssinus TaxID=6956 RepID=A0A6P6Y5D6_DERPT|nr:trafficking protein particle complex subunit 4-like [Dermatophagoides pteronyssinus]
MMNKVVNGIYSVYIISKSGGLIYNYDVESNFPLTEVEKTFSFPLDIVLEFNNQRLTVVFGQRDNIRVGYSLLAINGDTIVGRKYKDQDILDDFLTNEENFPVNLKFGWPRLSTNEKIVMASMFHSMYAIAALQIIPRKSSSSTNDNFRRHSNNTGIEYMETNNFRLSCFQTLTGVKFLIISDLRETTNKDWLLRKIYELYSDYALKNPFYKLDMPIRCELFDLNIAQLLEQNDRNLASVGGGDSSSTSANIF